MVQTLEKQFEGRGETSEQIKKNTLEAPKYNEAGLETLVNTAYREVGTTEQEVFKKTDARVENIPVSLGLEKQKAEEVFENGGFLGRIKKVKEKISLLANSTKEKIKGLVLHKPEPIHFKEMTESEQKQVGNISLEATKVQDVGINHRSEIKTLENEEGENIRKNSEKEEVKDLREYLEKEVFAKFGISVEDQNKTLIEAPENRKEVLRRSFENSRASVVSYYEMQVIEGGVDAYAVEKVQKQMTYDFLRPVLENSISKIQPKLDELGISVTLESLGFTPDMADRDDLFSAMNTLDYQVKLSVEAGIRQQITDSLLQTGYYKDIGIPTQEQEQDQEFIEKRGEKLRVLEMQAVEEKVKSIGFTKWMAETRAKLDAPYSFGNESNLPKVDINNFKFKRSKEQVTSELMAEKDLAEKTGFLCVNIDASKLEKVLAQGGFRDIFSLNQEELSEMNRVIGRGDAFYLNQRKTIESALGVYDPESPTVYGTFASENGHDEKYGGAELYGSIFLKIKPEKAAVYCEGDSMSGGNEISDNKLLKMGISTQADWAKAAQARQVAMEHRALIKALHNDNKKFEHRLGRGTNELGYLEAHIKDLKSSDIESINIPRSFVEGVLRGSFEQGDYRGLIAKLLKDPDWKDRINIIENV
jgi:hypothetical protein